MPTNNTDNIYSTEYEDSGTPIPSDKIGYDNSDSGLEATNVKAAIDELKTDIDSVTNDIESITVDSTTPLGASVSIASADFPYTFESDGYFQYAVTNGSGYVKFDVANGTDGSNPMQVVVPAHGSYNTINAINVKKGMRVSGIVDASNLGTFTFRPFIMENE